MSTLRTSVIDVLITIIIESDAKAAKLDAGVSTWYDDIGKALRHDILWKGLEGEIFSYPRTCMR